MAGLSRQIPDDHPNAEHLRQRLTIISQKEKRGLHFPTEAEQLRQQTHAATHRSPRPDWQPDEAALRAINRRHEAATRRFAQRYSIRSEHLYLYSLQYATTLTNTSISSSPLLNLFLRYFF
ncbi:hypothetical protein [Hymenobacter pini]|uniref:hypothetical protein n=1 Tax=Hymenobacter pini TaxID=2880879 RepID=UPI001CF13224|nr:hypothetical protein [Hymenobacter pini]MCA8831902.1 hypothetical protein [Hymenobacter pini]